MNNRAWYIYVDDGEGPRPATPHETGLFYSFVKALPSSPEPRPQEPPTAPPVSLERVDGASPASAATDAGSGTGAS